MFFNQYPPTPSRVITSVFGGQTDGGGAGTGPGIGGLAFTARGVVFCPQTVFAIGRKVNSQESCYVTTCHVMSAAREVIIMDESVE